MANNEFNHARLARIIAKQTLYSLEVCCLPDGITEDEGEEVMDLVIKIADRITKENAFCEKVCDFRDNPKKRCYDSD